ncbi:hypothetical protein KTE49_20565 [Burkholderia multivorans]|uniref:hypothetical protein n=1 Tax=Burkholderia multivorans TaxID=87883 RepID=UPI001C267D69|nr:hypothetical protein [Burkholderia multivorans]MBU9532831.1 hypothetical protein [Burkholderia multivorans]
MELKDAFNGDNAALISSINALLALDEHNVLTARDLGRSARPLLAAAAVRLETTAAEAEKNRVAWLAGPIPAPPPDGLRIMRAVAGSDPCWQNYEVYSSKGGDLYYGTISVERRIYGKDEDLPTFSLIERRLLAGNPVEV